MNLEDQVCSLELSKRLKELRVKREPYFWWIDGDIIGNSEFLGMSPIEKILLLSGKIEAYPAFTVAELGEMLPEDLYEDKDDPDSVLRHLCIEKSEGWDVSYCFSHYYKKCRDDNMANAMAKMLIYLLEKGLIK